MKQETLFTFNFDEDGQLVLVFVLEDGDVAKHWLDKNDTLNLFRFIQGSRHITVPTSGIRTTETK